MIFLALQIVFLGIFSPRFTPFSFPSIHIIIFFFDSWTSTLIYFYSESQNPPPFGGQARWLLLAPTQIPGAGTNNGVPEVGMPVLAT